MVNPKSNKLAEWIINRITKMPAVFRAEIIEDGIIKIDRMEYSPCVLAFFDKSVTVKDIESLRDSDQQVDFVLGIPSSIHWGDGVVPLMREYGLAYGRMGDFERALDDENLRSYVSRETVFIERGLKQHGNIEEFTCLNEGSYELKRKKHKNLIVVIIAEYELTAQEVRSIKDKNPAVDIIVNSSPSGSNTNSAYQVADDIGIELLRWREFLARLHKP